MTSNTETERGYESIYNEEESWAPELQQYGLVRESQAHGSDQLQFTGEASVFRPMPNLPGRQSSIFGNGVGAFAFHEAQPSMGGGVRVNGGGARGGFQATAVGQAMNSHRRPAVLRFSDVVHERASPESATAYNLRPSHARPGPSMDFGGTSTQRAPAQRRRRTGLWTDGQLQAAIAAIDSGAKLKAVARDYSIPASSLRDHIYGKTLKRKKGRQGVLSVEEDEQLVKYLFDMQERAHPLSITDVRMKVAELTQDRWTPFKNGVPGAGWLRWFRRRHPELTLRAPQCLEEGRARGLNPTSVASLYRNLEFIFRTHNYPADHIWNADESGAQAGRSGGGNLVFAKRGTRSVHAVVPDAREHITVLSCINAAGQSIPNYYIFKGRRRERDYICKCEVGATMSMQDNAWMSSYLFAGWISHFINVLGKRFGISPENRHLLVLDGHGSHVTLDVVVKAKEHGLDVLSLPSHTSHRLQPLDVSIFKPFKVAFRGYRDAWSVRNRGQGASKEDLAQWVSLGLRKALTPANIIKGFRTTGIWPLNPNAMDKYTGPSQCFETEAPENGDGQPIVSGSESEPDGGEGTDQGETEADPGMEELLGERIPSSQPAGERFYVPSDPDDSDREENGGRADHEPVNNAPLPALPNLFELPRVIRPARRQRHRNEPLIDYSSSILMTSDEYIETMEAKAARKEAVLQEKEERKQVVERRKLEKEREKQAKDTLKVLRRIEAERKKLLKEREKARREAEKERKQREAATGLEQQARKRRRAPTRAGAGPSADGGPTRAGAGALADGESAFSLAFDHTDHLQCSQDPTSMDQETF